MKKIHLLLVIIACILWQCKTDTSKELKTVTLEKQPNEGIVAANGMVVTAHPLATEIGLEVLKKGGNAFDAAVAVKYTLSVVLPKAGNLGGGGYMVYRTADGKKGALDFRETAPARASRDMFIDTKTDSVMKQKALLGHLAACTPGTVDGMDKIHKKFCTLPFDTLIQPAIHTAKNGFAISEYDAWTFNRAQQDFRAVNDSTMLFIKNKPWMQGDSLIQKNLAKTLERIRDFGRDGFYKGETAQLLLDEMNSGGGIISKEDLENYNAVWREPIEGVYRDSFNIISMPPSSSGGIIIVQLLKGSNAYDIKKMGHNTPETIHVMTELQRRAYADRAEHMGDLDFYDVP
ncbi:MAG: gamma-glutamyltransferase, partial [Bacteroidota bacterium]